MRLPIFPFTDVPMLTPLAAGVSFLDLFRHPDYRHAVPWSRWGRPGDPGPSSNSPHSARTRCRRFRAATHPAADDIHLTTQAALAPW
jgi:hypothetical protein